MENRVIDTDSYKASHWLQYPPKTTLVHSYLESRGSQCDYLVTVFFGLQYILKKYFTDPITQVEIDEANAIAIPHGEPFNYQGWLNLLKKHQGRLPLRIRSVPEGSCVPIRNVLMTIENTDPEFYWLTSWFETQFLRIWYPVTVATQSFYIKRDIYRFLQDTSDNPDEEILYKLHDFGSRGVSSAETAAIGGAAHLVNFLGTDTMPSLVLHRKYYHADMAGFSIPAAEHSTITAWGRENELNAYKNMLENFAQKGKSVAIVSDSWDIYHAVEKIWGGILRESVINSEAIVFIRPDSGEPTEVVAKVANILADKFGTKTNSKGYKVLNNVRIIQGDGVNTSSIREILEKLKNLGFSASNIDFGIGGALLQKISRDTMKFAYKCSAIKLNGKLQDVYKQPITDIGKTSKRGRLDLVLEDGEYQTIKLDANQVSAPNSQMITAFENGEIFLDDSLEKIRKRAEIGFLSNKF